MQAGDCFVNQSAQGVPSHLWIVVSDPEIDSENVLIVNLTDANKHYDDSCILMAGDHPWITKDSCVAFQFANVTSVQHLKEADASGLLRKKDPVSNPVLERIRDGAFRSDELKGSHRILLRDQKLID